MTYTKIKHAQADLLTKDEVMGKITAGDVLRKIRVDKDKTLKQFSKKIGVSENTLVGWELDRNAPKFDLFCDILNANGYDVIVRKRD